MRRFIADKGFDAHVGRPKQTMSRAMSARQRQQYLTPQLSARRPALAGAGADRPLPALAGNPNESAAQRARLDRDARRRRRGAALWHAVEVRGACHPPRRVVAHRNAAKSSVSFTPLHELDGIITPNGLCFERHHGGIAEIDPDDYRLMLHGLVDKPLIFTLDDIKRMPRVNRVHFLECAANSGMEWRGAQLNGCQYTHGMVHCVDVHRRAAARAARTRPALKPNAKWLLAGRRRCGRDDALACRSRRRSTIASSPIA